LMLNFYYCSWHKLEVKDLHIHAVYDNAECKTQHENEHNPNYMYSSPNKTERKKKQSFTID